MRRIDSLGMCLLLLTGVLISISAETTCAQDAPSETQRSIRTVAEKFDEYGKVGHCDMSARLDNFAISLMNEPEAKGFIISFDPQAKKYEHAERSLRIARHYLINTRGIAAERIITIHGGSRDVKEEVTELWMGAEGAAPPITPSSKDKYSATDFSGLFSSYTTDERIYREVVELGYSAVDIAHSEFAEKLKQQPDSVGYLLIRTSKNSPAGGWPRIARRDEQILHKGHSVGTERLTSINGGRSDGEYTLVELWVVPKSSAPPVGVTDEAEAKLSTAIKLNTYETFGGVEGDAENWMLENLAEMLREHPRATAVLVVREPSEAIEIGSEDEAVSAVEPALVSEEKIPVDAGDASATSGVAVEPETEIEISMTDLAGKWKNILETKHGVEAGRIVVREGHRTSWGNGKLTTWVVPHGVELPDPFADPDEQEELEGESSGQVGVDSEPEELSKSPPHDIPAPISPKTEATPAGLTQHKPGN